MEAHLAERVAAHLPRRIRARREELRLTQKALAVLLGISYQQLQKYETGSDRISASMLIKLARELGCRPSDLLVECQLAAAAEEVDGRLENPEIVELLDLYARLPTPRLRRNLVALVAEFVKRDAA